MEMLVAGWLTDLGMLDVSVRSEDFLDGVKVGLEVR